MAQKYPTYLQFGHMSKLSYFFLFEGSPSTCHCSCQYVYAPHWANTLLLALHGFFAKIAHLAIHLWQNTVLKNIKTIDGLECFARNYQILILTFVNEVIINKNVFNIRKYQNAN